MFESRRRLQNRSTIFVFNDSDILELHSGSHWGHTNADATERFSDRAPHSLRPAAVVHVRRLCARGHRLSPHELVSVRSFDRNNTVSKTDLRQPPARLDTNSVHPL